MIQNGYGSPSHVQFTKYAPIECTSKTVQIFLKCGQIRLMLLMNEFEFGPYLVHLWSVLGASDLYNKRYSFEQNHKMLNPNHLRNVQPHLFVEISKNPKFSISTWTIQNKPKTCITDNFRKKKHNFMRKWPLFNEIHKV